MIGKERLRVSAPMFGQIEDDLKLCVYASGAGSAFVLLSIVDGDSDLGPLLRIADAFEKLPAGWTTTTRTTGAVVPVAASAILAGGSLTPMEAFDALAEPARRAARRAIRVSLLDGGFERIGAILLRS